MQARRWRWTRIAMGVCAILILTAVPAAAITWTSTWTTGFGQKGTVTVAASNNGATATGTSTLTVNWGTSGGGKASGKFKASRSFTLAAGETRVSVDRAITTLLRDGGADAVNVKVKRNVITVSGKIKGVYDQAASASTITVSGA